MTRTRVGLLWALGVAVAVLGVGCADETPPGDSGDDTSMTADVDDDTAEGEDTTVSGDTGAPGDTSTPSDTAMPPGDVADTHTMTDTGPAQCVDGQTQCSTMGHVETCSGGQFVVTAMCDAGCKSAACAEPGATGTCAEPVAFGVGTTVTGTTATVYNPNTWSQTCRSDYVKATGVPSVDASTTGPETVYRLGVAEPQMLRLTLTPDPTAQTYLALYVRSACGDPGSTVHSTCGGNDPISAPYVQEAFFAPGEYYVFVDSFGPDPSEVGGFELQVEPILLPECEGQIPLPLDVRQPVAITGDTADGSGRGDWLSSECPVIQSSSGTENLYVFGLAQASTVQIAANAIMPPESQIALYVRSKCTDRYEQVGCAHTTNGGTAAIQETLPAGAYYLFVDDFIGSIDEPQSYNLTVDVLP